MAALGKRKREFTVIRKKKPAERPEDKGSTHHDLFKDYFESQFQPLPAEEQEAEHVSRQQTPDESEISGSDESEWEGLSENGPSDSSIQIVEHGNSASTLSSGNNSAEQKFFMVSAMIHHHSAKADVSQECQTPKQGQKKLRAPRKAAC
jgi:hypothetical protein